jgi:peroxiredoxin
MKRSIKEDTMTGNIPDIGQNAPDFETLTSDSKRFVLSEALKSGHPVKLLFYRGHW